ncbi:MAG: dihydrolipoamide acetyltransferase family protein [Roseiflexaceae bacterium]
MPKDVIMPKFGFTQETAEIVRWLRQAGDLVEQGDPIAEVTTDKVNMEVEAPATGVLEGLRFQAGEVVPVTAVIAVIRDPRELPAAPAPAAQPATEEPAAPLRRAPTPVARRVAETAGVDLAAVAGSGPSGRVMRRDVEAHLSGAEAAAPPNGKVRAAPAARRLGQELGVDLAGLRGSGPQGRIQSADVLAAHRRSQPVPQPAPAPAPAAPPPEAPALPPGVLRAIPLAGMRRTIATRLQRSAQEAPHIYLEADIDVGAAEDLRARANSQLPPGQPRVSLTAIIARCCGWALQRHPLVNSRLHDDRILLMGEVHIGVAVALDEGLIVPVVRAVPQKGLLQLAAELAGLAERARAGRLRPEEVQDSTFTISNLGMYGVDRFTAIINPPTSAILAVGRTRRMFVPDEHDQPVVRPILTVTLSADHRVIDGAVAGRFLADLRAAVEQPERMLL